MPIRLPATETTPTTKNVTPNGLESEGPNREYFTILDYLDAAVNDAARKSATTTTTNAQGRLLSEVVDNTKYSRALVNAQLKGWRTIVPPGMAFDAARMFEEDGNYFWQFTVQNIADLPEDIVLWLAGEIVSCGGVIPTESLRVVTDSGQVLDFRRPAKQLGGIGESEVSPAIGDAAIPAGSPGDSVS
jgi:hypothetical protein